MNCQSRSVYFVSGLMSILAFIGLGPSAFADDLSELRGDIKALRESINSLQAQIQDLNQHVARGNPPGDNPNSEPAAIWKLRQAGANVSRSRPYFIEYWGDDEGLRAISDLSESAISRLTLRRSKITDKALPYLMTQKHLNRLDLGETQISGGALAFLVNMKELSELMLDHTGIDDSGLDYLKNNPRLKLLRLNGTKVTPKGLSAIKGLTRLEHLELSGISLEDDDLKFLSGLRNLKVLRLAGLPSAAPKSKNPTFAGAGLQYLVELTNLESISLLDTKISDDSIKYLVPLTGLRSLQLNQGFSKEGLENLRKLTQLEHLDDANLSNSEQEYLLQAIPKLQIFGD